ncbi:DUF4003 family protein [Saccharibacillus sp. CPCC 101409]|uniref:DUF4003 family protein n=1 Tax=Saccharibacillus sp. CPCC 101409 TaxID=3058041 RepID=UPI002673F13B|nr:DUF4003 family protein [Saccharibacillus sp. CPCC 101409]MDO3413033.1 DUF4003 family protein [Saccharibacillus sp. CPCC 101409]
MNEQTIARAALLAENALEIKREFKWKNAMTGRLAALLYAAQDRPADIEAIRAQYEQIKQNTSGFSPFRSTMALSISAFLSMSDDPAALLSDMLEVYELLKEDGFKTSDFLAMAAYLIAAAGPEMRITALDRTKAFYHAMKKEHRFLTGRDDYIFAAMLGLSDLDVETGVTQMERAYAALRGELRAGNGLQSLTQVMTLAGGGEAVDRVLGMREAFRARGIRLDQQYLLPVLGVLALLPIEAPAVAEEVSKMFDFLREQQGFGRWSATKQEVMMLAAALVSQEHADEVGRGELPAAPSTSLANVMLAQHAALAAAAAAAASAAAASS